MFVRKSAIFSQFRDLVTTCQDKGWQVIYSVHVTLGDGQVRSTNPMKDITKRHVAKFKYSLTRFGKSRAVFHVLFIAMLHNRALSHCFADIQPCAA